MRSGVRQTVFAMAAVAIALGGVGPVWAADAAREGGTISVSATARASVANEVAEVSVGVEAHGATVAATQGALTEAGGRLLDYLRGVQGVEQLRTEQLSVSPRVAPPVPGAVSGPAKIVGFDGVMRVGFRVPAGQVGTVSAGALEHGGNVLDRVAFTPREEALDATRARLAAEAVKTALAEAATVASAAGRRLGMVRSIAVEPNGGGPIRMPMRAMAAAAPMPAEAGAAEVMATVSVTVALIEP